MLEDKNPSRTPLSNLGEFGLIDHLTKGLPKRVPTTLFGVGDDAAVIDSGEDSILTSTDMLVENVHFDLTYVPLKHLGYKSVVVNLSDIYAMGGRPEQILVSMALSNRFTVEAVDEIYKGIYLACEQYGVDLVGGDTTSSNQGLVLSITAIGRTKKDKVIYRSGAKPTDLIVVTGDLGGAYMGLQILEREKSVYMGNPEMQPELQGHEYVLERQLKPEARKDVVEMFEGLEIHPTSMIDISDGLSSEVLHLTRSSKTGSVIYEDRIPIDPTVFRLCEEFNLNTTTVALNGGEDYELLFTLPVSDHEKIKGNPNLTVIGHVTEEDRGNYLITRDGVAVELTARGWNPLGEEND